MFLKNGYANVYRGYINIYPKLETTQMSLEGDQNK